MLSRLVFSHKYIYISSSKFISHIKALFVWIQVLSADSGSFKCKVLGFLPRELAQYLSPLMEKYCLSFEVIYFLNWEGPQFLCVIYSLILNYLCWSIFSITCLWPQGFY